MVTGESLPPAPPVRVGPSSERMRPSGPRMAQAPSGTGIVVVVVVGAVVTVVVGAVDVGEVVVAAPGPAVQAASKIKGVANRFIDAKTLSETG